MYKSRTESVHSGCCSSKAATMATPTKPRPPVTITEGFIESSEGNTLQIFFPERHAKEYVSKVGVSITMTDYAEQWSMVSLYISRSTSRCWKSEAEYVSTSSDSSKLRHDA